MEQILQPGQSIARGVCRHLRSLGFTSITEFVPKRGLRVDVAGVGPKGEIWVIECKSSRADFRSDQKWQGYLDWCDRYFWAVGPEFPMEILPPDTETGRMIADEFDAEIVAYGPEAKLPPARRKALTLKIARTAMDRLSWHTDPSPTPPTGGGAGPLTGLRRHSALP